MRFIGRGENIRSGGERKREKVVEPDRQAERVSLLTDWRAARRDWKVTRKKDTEAKKVAKKGTDTGLGLCYVLCLFRRLEEEKKKKKKTERDKMRKNKNTHFPCVPMGALAVASYIAAPI